MQLYLISYDSLRNEYSNLGKMAQLLNWRPWSQKVSVHVFDLPFTSCVILGK